MQIFELTKEFPKEETYSLTDQIRRASRSVCGNIAEGWRKSKLNDAESEAGETQAWLEFSVQCKYIKRETGLELYQVYDNIIGKLVRMENNPDPWILKRQFNE